MLREIVGRLRRAFTPDLDLEPDYRAAYLGSQKDNEALRAALLDEQEAHIHTTDRLVALHALLPHIEGNVGPLPEDDHTTTVREQVKDRLRELGRL